MDIKINKIGSLLLFVILSACGGQYLQELYTPPTAQEQQLLTNPPAGLLKAIEPQVPILRQQVLHGEAIALRTGRSLTAYELSLARKVGVRNPEKIRVAVTKPFPFEETGMSARGVIAAQTFRYGIFMKPDIPYNTSKYYEILTHEFAHVRQFEEAGLTPLVRRFLIESVILENKLIPIEQDAIIIGESVYNDPDTVYGFGFLKLGAWK